MDTPVFKEPLLGYYPCCIGFLTGRRRTVDGTVSVGQFDWGGRLPKSNGGARKVRSGRSATVRGAQEHKRA